VEARLSTLTLNRSLIRKKRGGFREGRKERNKDGAGVEKADSEKQGGG